MKQIGYSALLATCTAVVILLVSERASASDSFNLCGKYVSEQNEDISTLEVVQNNENIEITRVKFGKKTVSHCPFNGSDGDYTSTRGESGKCKAKLTPKYLIIEYDVMTHPQHAVPTRIHTKEKWQLSSDEKTLTIKYAAGFSDLPTDLWARMRGSGTVKYKRTNP